MKLVFADDRLHANKGLSINGEDIQEFVEKRVASHSELRDLALEIRAHRPLVAGHSMNPESTTLEGVISIQIGRDRPLVTNYRLKVTTTLKERTLVHPLKLTIGL